MEPSDIESVLNFFRKNHLSVSESALVDDIFEKSQLDSSGFDTFLLPTSLSSLKIPAHRRPPPAPETSDGSSDQEFISLGSPTADFCLSEFTNPYAIRVKGASSHASSDRMSQFGTARDYHEFDMQTDLNWYREKDEDYAMPSFDNPDPFSGIEKDVDLEPNFDYDAAKVEEGAAAFDANDESLIKPDEDEYEVFDLRIIHRKNRTGFEESKDLPIVLNSVIGSRYAVAEYLGSAVFSKVVRARDLQTGDDVCLKIIKNEKDFFDQSLDEIKLLKLVNKNDPADERHILRLYDYFYFHEHLIIVSELLRANLYEFQKYNKESGAEPYFTMTRLQVITRQCLEALDYLHGLGIIHCDLKPENILIKSYSRSEIKIIDFGSSCFQNDKLSLYVQSRSYRAPEVILGIPYDQKIDLWSLGCILAELSSGDVLFPNDELVFLLARVIGMLGPIDIDMLESGQETSKYFTNEFDLYHINEESDEVEYISPQETSLEEHIQVSDTLFINFIRMLLEINPQRRSTARKALKHPWLSFPYD